jgi:SPP1 family predicted phage head-tail adaptor
MVRAGKMRHRVLIEERTDEQDSSGQQLDVWTTFARRWAERLETPGSESSAPQQQFARVPTVWRLRFIAGVLPSMRLTSGGKLYDIISAIDREGMGAETHITTLERVGEPAP